MIVLRSSLWGSPDQRLENALDETLNSNPNLVAAFESCCRGSLFYHVPRECRVKEFDAISPWQPAYTWLVAQASPAGRQNRKRYANALASGSTQMVFDGGWMVPLGQEQHTEALRKLIRQLPPVEFRPAKIQQQPVVVRVAKHQGKLWMYAANPSAIAVDVTLRLSCDSTTPIRVLNDEATYQMEPSASKGSLIRFPLAAYEAWCCELNDPDARVSGVDVRCDDKSLQLLEKRMQELNQRITRIQPNAEPTLLPLVNPGFEQRDTKETELPGWQVTVRNSSFWAVDTKNARSGNSSLMLSARRDDGLKLSTPLEPQSSRFLTMGVWLRASEDGIPVRLSFETTIQGEPRVQEAEIQVDTQWRHYLFRVKDIPTEQIEEPRVGIELTGPAKIWIDDVEVESQQLSPGDLRQLTKAFAAISIAWEEKRYSDCERLLGSYWGCFAFDTPIRAPASEARPPRSASRFPRFFRR